MTKSKTSSKKEHVKDKFSEFIKERVKPQVKNFQEKATNYVEEQIDAKIKKEITQLVKSGVGYLLLILGGLFVFYSLILLLVSMLSLPEEITPLVMGICLLIAGYFMR